MSRDKRSLFEQLVDEVRRSQSATERYDEAVSRTLGVNRTDMRCLDVLERVGRISAGELAEATGLTSGAMTTALDRLERRGFARRVPDPGDRRRVLVEITEAVGTVSERFYREHSLQAERLYQRYTAEEIELLLRFVREGREFNEAAARRLEEELG